MTLVEKYLYSKNIDYRLDGDNAVAQCPICKQGDKWGIHVESGAWQCFRGSCGAKGNLITLKKHFGDSFESKQFMSDNNNWNDEVTQVKSKSKQEALPDVEAAHKLLLEDDEVLNWLNDERGFSLDVIKQSKLGLGKRKFSDGKAARALMFPYFKKGKCCGVKYRSLPPDPKDFRFTSGHDVGLYREDIVVKDMESLVIVEGEADAICLLSQGILNVVAVSGANAKDASWSPLLDLPKKIYLIMDNDQVGVEAAKAFATRFGVDKFNIVNIPKHELDVPVVDKHGTRTTVKDVNDFFLSGHTVEEFNELLEAARPFDIEGVTTMDDAFENIIHRYNNTGTFDPPYQFKWPKINERARGYDDGDLVVVLASPKVGKTTFLINEMESFAEKYGKNVHFDCMEMEPEANTKKWAAMVLNVDENILTIEQMKQAQKMARNRPNGFLFTRSCPTSLDDYIAFLRRVKARYNSGAIVIDNFQILVDLTIGKNSSNNRPSYMSQVSKRLKALANELRCPIFLISQPRGLEDGQMVSAAHSEGSTTLMKDCDLFFTLNREVEMKMKMSQIVSMGNVETNQSHSTTMYVNVELSRRSAGGLCTLKIEGEKCLVTEFSPGEGKAATKQAMVNGIQFVDDNERAEI